MNFKRSPFSILPSSNDGFIWPVRIRAYVLLSIIVLVILHITIGFLQLATYPFGFWTVYLVCQTRCTAVLPWIHFMGFNSLKLCSMPRFNGAVRQSTELCTLGRRYCAEFYRKCEGPFNILLLLQPRYIFLNHWISINLLLSYKRLFR